MQCEGEEATGTDKTARDRDGHESVDTLTLRPERFEVLQPVLNGLPMAVGLHLESGTGLIMERSGQSVHAFTIQETMETL